MYIGSTNEAITREIGAVSAHAPWVGSSSGSSLVCLVSGKMGRGKAVCKFKDADCRPCGKKGHLPNVCRHNTNNGKGKGKGKNKTKDFSQSKYRQQ